jgi:hypothetical protein
MDSDLLSIGRLIARRPHSGRHRGSARFPGLVLALAAALLALPATAAFAAWTDPDDLSPAGHDARISQVGEDSGGNALVVWERFDGTNHRVQARTRTAGGDLLATQTLSAAGHDANDPQVAVNPSTGDAVVVWQRSDGTNNRVQDRARTAAGTWSAIQTLSDAGGDAGDPQVGLDSAGNAVVVWERFDGTNQRVQARVRSAGGGLSAVQTLSAAGHDAVLPQVGVDPGGDAVVVWPRHDGTNYRVQARARAAGGTVSAIQTLSAAGQDAVGPQVAVDSGANAVVVWQGFDGTNRRIEARARSAGGVVGPIQTMSAAGQDAFVPQVAADSAGNAVLVWERSDGSTYRVQARTRTAGGAVSATQTLSAAGESGLDPQLGLDSAGNAVVVWYRSDGSNARVQARTRAAGGTMGAIQTLSIAGQDATEPQVAVNAGGAAVGTWTRDDAGITRIQAAAGP